LSGAALTAVLIRQMVAYLFVLIRISVALVYLDLFKLDHFKIV